MRTPIWVLAAIVTVWAGAFPAAQAGSARLPPVLSALLGDWNGRGTVSGRPATVAMTWSLELAGRFVHLRFRNEMAPTATRPIEVLESHGYYRAASPDATGGVGTWIDSRGVILPLSLTLSGNTLTSDWGSESTERGRTTYVLLGPDRLEVTDLVRLPDGQYRPFGQTNLSRTPR
ncbi:MAG: hypothetical protein ABL986_00215 [Vicinamibacterales bacterium]